MRREMHETPFRRSVDLAPEDEVALAHLAAHVHALGPRAVAEIIGELADGYEIRRQRERWSRLTPAMLDAVGGRGFPHRLPIAVGT
jgi:hypothetical protein